MKKKHNTHPNQSTMFCVWCGQQTPTFDDPYCSECREELTNEVI